MTIEQMKGKLLEWNPSWNVDRFTDRQVVVIYNKEMDKRRNGSRNTRKSYITSNV